MLGSILGHFKRKKELNAWREQNAHNETIMKNRFNPELVSVGNYTYGDLTILNFSEDVHVKIGHYCSIASGVVFAACADHATKTISTYPFKVKCAATQVNEALSKGDIVVDDDVWIGQDAIVLSGVHIGQGAIVAAGAIVTKDVPPYAIVAGNPAKILKYRFDETLINELVKIDYGKLDKKLVTENIDSLYVELTDVKQLNWLPKR